MFLWNSELESTASKGHVCSAVFHCLLHTRKHVVFSSWFSYLWSHVEGSNDFSPYHSWSRHHHCALFCGLTCSHHPPFSISFCSMLFIELLLSGDRPSWMGDVIFGTWRGAVFTSSALSPWCVDSVNDVKNNDTFRFILSKCRFSLVGNIKSPLP